MPSRNEQVKQETRVDKIGKRNLDSRLKSTELPTRGRVEDVKDASQVFDLSGSQSRRDSISKPIARKVSIVGSVNSPCWIPVVSKTGKPLMPTRPKRVVRLVRAGKAVGKWKTGIFYIQLTDREDGIIQPVAVGIDPGSKREAFTVKSAKHTYLNVLTDAVTWVKDAIETRRNMRRDRRFRKTPCRQNRENRARGGIPPSTKARWQAKLRVSNVLSKLFPVGTWVIEDIQAKTMKNGKRWNVSFSPLEVGKKWFYSEMEKRGVLVTKQGWETKNLRDSLGLVKTKGKMEERFSAHNLDSWVLANSVVGGHVEPDNETIWRMIPLRFHRRQLHRLQATDGVRNSYGGTMSCGLKRGSLVRHAKWGLCYVGGYSEGKGISLHGLDDGERICQNAKKEDLSVLRFGSWRYRQAA